MQNAPDDLNLLHNLSPLDEPGVSAGVPVGVRRAARSMLLAVILVPVFAIVTYCVLFFCAVAFAMTFGDFPWHESEVLREAGEFMVRADPSLRLWDHDATIRWVGGRKGAWEIRFSHKVTRKQRCVRWVNLGFALGMYTFEEIRCPPVTVRSGSAPDETPTGGSYRDL